MSLLSHLRISGSKLVEWALARLHNNRSRWFSVVLVSLGSSFLLVLYLRRALAKYHRATSLNPLVVGHEYDYIIVGAGSAGAVLANRLSDSCLSPSHALTVLLLEAGGSDDHLNVAVPAAAAKLQLTEHDWQFESVAQCKSHLAMNGQRSKWPRGKLLGGSSSINYTLWVRGDREDYDRWERNGCFGWSWNDVMPYFKRIESCDEHIPQSDTRGREGLMKVEMLKEPHEVTKKFVDACKSAGIPFTADYNGECNEGVSYAQYNTHRGFRCSTASAFLLPALQRANLHVLTYSHATRIVFNKNNEAMGVIFRRGATTAQLRQGKDHFVKARREVILCAGSVCSPQLLMLSGVGPKEHLRENNIRLIHDSPGVGQNMQDHLATPMMYRSKLRTLNDADETITNVAKLFIHGTGPLACCGVEAFVFMHSGARPDLLAKKSSVSTAAGAAVVPRKLPDIQFHYCPVTANPITLRIFNFTNEVQNAYLKLIRTGEYSHALFATLVRPKSTGFIALANDDPFSHPTIQPNYLDDADDVACLVSSCLQAEALMEQPAMRDVMDAPAKKGAGYALDTMMVDNPFDRVLQPLQWWTHFVRATSLTLYHSSCTVRMGSADDPLSPLDTEFRVKGVKRLRVVDASAMPEIVSGNTNAPVIMLAERASDFILGKSHLSHQPVVPRTPVARMTSQL